MPTFHADLEATAAADEAFVLPPAPGHLQGPVKAWSKPVVLPSYMPEEGNKNPMFLHKRVYQGSSGQVYPLPFIDRIATGKQLWSWDAVHIENEYVRLMVLPEIGGRIHLGLDKTNSYDFFYRQNVIKPALVGLAGPWISGGVEFNWPQHHRPATFMPVSVHIEEHTDGARTIWCSDHDPMTRMKGMHGICLYPGRSYVEIKVRLFNRTPLTQTFLWWTNAGVHVDEHYQSVLPEDVEFVVDHARRATNTYPLAKKSYYGVNYSARAEAGVPAEEAPSRLVPPGTYAANDLRWYANIPVPTSYMAIGSVKEFLGGYDHRRKAGVVHVADHRIAPGKKQWTWGNHEFGYAWDRNLTDNDGPYVELMAGVYTDNQPDFSFLAPYETKTFSEFWYPVRDIGPAQQANVDAAVTLSVANGVAQVGVSVTSAFPGATVSLEWNGLALASWVRDLTPGLSLKEEAELRAEVPREGLTLRVVSSKGRELIAYTARTGSDEAATAAPLPAEEPLDPKKVGNGDELYAIGVHLAQYRHATRNPEEYWAEALKRNPGDARCNIAMGDRHLRRGEFQEAEEHLRRAIEWMTKWNANPADGEAFYLLGVCLRFLDRTDEAYDAFYKATWNYAWRAPALYALAEIDVRRGQWERAPKHLHESLRLNADNNNVRCLGALVFQHFGRTAQASALLGEALAIDPLDAWAKHISGGPITGDNQIRIDIACDYLRAGLHAQAAEVLTGADIFATDGSVPMVHYLLAYAYAKAGNFDSAEKAYAAGGDASPARCFPYRLEELMALESAVMIDAADAHAFQYLGNWLYGHRRETQALDCWTIATRLQPGLATSWRNLGIGLFNVRHDEKGAREAYDKAFAADPSDARVLFERDQLWKRLNVRPVGRLKELEAHRDLVSSRDDLSLELAALYNLNEQPELAAAVLASRRFQPCEGGEGLVLAQHTRTEIKLGKRRLKEDRPEEARCHFLATLHPPENLGEARHLLEDEAEIHFWLGEAWSAAGDIDSAAASWQRASARFSAERQHGDAALTEQTVYAAMAKARLGEGRESRIWLRQLWFYGRKLARTKGSIDYFATSIPSLLLFDDDLTKRNRIKGLLLQTQARVGLRQWKLARKALEQVLALDPNNERASELVSTFAQEQSQDGGE